MEKTLKGSLGAASAFQLTEDMSSKDKPSKKILQYREVLAIILKETVEEYQGYSEEEIMEFIEADSITDATEVSGGRTNTRIGGTATEFAELEEKTSNFDIAFRARNPCLSNGDVVVNLYVDVVTEKTDYGQLEKCYSIWICRERVPKDEQMSISFYKMMNYRNVGKCHPKEENYDLMTLVIIRLGNKNYYSEEKSVLDFLTMIFYPHFDGFRERVSKYISFEEVLGEEEEKNMIDFEYCVYATAREEGIEEGHKEGLKEGLKAGIEEGLQLKQFLLVCKKLAKGKTIAEIADALEEPEDVVQALCEKAAAYAPEYDEGRIRKNWRSMA